MQNSSQGRETTICERIRTLAAERGLTNQDLAKRSRISYRLVHEIMHGRARLRDRTIASIAPALGVEYEWLATGRGNREVAAPLIKEEAGDYAADPRSDLPPLHKVIAQLAIHVGCEEEEILTWVLKRMSKGRDAGR